MRECALYLASAGVAAGTREGSILGARVLGGVTNMHTRVAITCPLHPV